MKNWNVPVVEELDLTLTAGGVHGKNDESHQFELSKGDPAEYPGLPKEDPRTDS